MPGPSVMVRVLGDVTGLGQSFTNAGTQGQTAASKMHTAFSGVLGQLNQTGVLGPFGATLAGADSALQAMAGHAKSIGPVMMGVGAAATGVGIALQQAGSKDAAAHQQLAAAIQATGGSYDDYATKVDAAIKQQENFGNTSSQTQDALRLLTQATGDPTTALQYLGTAADLAAAKHEDLTTAAGQLGKAANGAGKILKDYGIAHKDAAGHVLTHTQVLDALSQKLSGQASASVNTFSGHLDVLKAKVEDHIAMFGQQYGPAITMTGAALTGLGATVEIVSAATSFLKDQQIIATVATNAQAAAQWALNTAMDANPIMIIVLAIAALIAIVILAYTHVTWFRNVVDDFGHVAEAAFNGFLGVVQDLWNWISGNWPLLLAILTGPIGLAVFLITKYWNDFVGFFQGIPGAIGNVASGMWDAIANAFKSTLNTVIDLWNSLKFTTPSFSLGPIHTPSVTIGVPQIPHLAEGGVVTRSGLIYAHAGEAVTPMRGGLGPMVNIENANFASELDIETFMKRAAWHARTAAV